MRPIIRQIFIVFAILGIFVAISAFYIVLRQYESEKYFKYYASYLELINLASGLEDYKKQNNVWPAGLEELFATRQDLIIDRTDPYGNPVVFVPYSSDLGYGRLISYGRDGKPGGENHFDQDLEIRFPVEAETNAVWNQRVSEQFTNRTARGLW